MKNNETILKLCKLIEICKITQNYGKLTQTLYILLSNQANEIGIRLGFPPRSHPKYSSTHSTLTTTQFNAKSHTFRESRNNLIPSIYNYYLKINNIMAQNIDFELFPAELLRNVKKIELLYHKSKGNLPLAYLSQMIEIYFELKKIELPNLYKKIKREKIERISDLQLFSSFVSKDSSQASQKKLLRNKGKEQNNNIDGIKPLILFQLKKKEQSLRTQLKESYDPTLVEDMLLLKQIKQSFKNNDSSKITIKSSLAESISYQKSISSLFGYLLLGICIFSIFMVVNMFSVVFTNPIMLSAVGIFLLLFSGLAIFFFYIYWRNFI
ncbi:MAG: hypothetical protein BAJALOKI1v1_430011 [Promethearchaeota archaeon]|nr:MAG: hypothetical protein BAJALOKI1v1_430011 [Candidatus Lokiarchaeota archaeon]